MKHIHKFYNSAFLLEPTKLNRLLGKIHERLDDHDSLVQHDSFEVSLTGGRREEMTNVHDVLNLDNSSKRQIQRLLIVSSGSTPGSPRPSHEIQIDFGGSMVDIHSAGTIKYGVAISVRSEDTGWADRTLSELEEQVERTWLPHTSHVLTLVGILLLLLITLTVSQFGTPRPPPQVRANAMWLQDSDLDQVEAFVRDQHTLTDQELKELVSRQLRNVLASERPKTPAPASNVRQTLFIAVPVVILLTCIVILFGTCYPRAVFLWGDEEMRWAATLRRRNVTWGVMGAILVGGLLANPFFEGMARLLPNK
jgi:hypothetical protein